MSKPFLDLGRDFQNPTVKSVCEKHGETDFVECYFEETGDILICVQCMNAAQRAMWENQVEAMKKAGVEVQEVKFETVKIIDEEE